MAKKQPGEDLDGELKSTLENASDEELKKKVSEVALLRSAIQAQMKKDPDVKQAREDLANTLRSYKEDIKGADHQIDFISYLLEARGKL
jgi:N-glycosylase/DNA lyase